jgi:hypothetical protein
MADKIIELKIRCGTNDQNERQKPEYTVIENGEVILVTTDLLLASQATFNRVN